VPMHTDQDREFELVLGNKQLLSLLFLVFVLLGVFFAMGYAMGRNSAPVDIARQTPAVKSDDEAAPVRRPSAAAGLPPTIPADEVNARTSDAAPTAQPAPTPTAERAPVREEPLTPRLIDPKPGQVFLQVSAVARPEAELLVEVLSRKGFRAAMAPGPSENLIRVLVGPVTSDNQLPKLRADLEQSGFKSMVRRY
jgi:cell division septation protein DedD